MSQNSSQGQSLTVPGEEEFYFPHFLKFPSFCLIFPQTFLICAFIVILRMGKLPLISVYCGTYQISHISGCTRESMGICTATPPFCPSSQSKATKAKQNKTKQNKNKQTKTEKQKNQATFGKFLDPPSTFPLSAPHFVSGATMHSI